MRLCCPKFSVSSVVDYSYLPNSPLISSISNSVGLVALREYEPNSNLITGITNKFATITISQYSYSNDELGRRTQRIDTRTTVQTNTFGYNAKSELIAAALGMDNYDYDYDQIGNRLSAVSDVALVVSTNLYKSNPLNQYTNIAGSASSPSEPTYDLDGNMLSEVRGNGSTITTNHYTYNGENRLIQVSNSSVVVTFAYDYMGRRFSKTVYAISDLSSPTSDFRYVYDGWNMICEGRASSPSEPVSTNYYTWGLDLSGTLQGAGGIGGLLSVSGGTGATPSEYFPAYDANGNITEYTDTNATTVAHYEYGPFGNTINQTGTLSSNFVFRFSTKYFIPELGMYDYGYRYYSTDLGRWISRDPILEMGHYLVKQSTQLSSITLTLLVQNLNSDFAQSYVFLLNDILNDFDILGEAGNDIPPCLSC